MNLDLPELLDSWLLRLRAERKSPDTRKSYKDGVNAFLAWCEAEGIKPALNEPAVTAWAAALLDAGKTPNTVIARLRGVRRFSAWLAEKDEIPRDELAGVKAPKADEPVVPNLSTDELKALLATCKGKEFHNVRDRAVIRFMAETAARAAEVIGMEKPDVNLPAQVGIIRRGKGGAGRMVPFSPQCAATIDDYMRLRRRHPLADTSPLWLGERGRNLSYAGLYSALERRGEAAGIENMHPHRLRHTGAVRWLSKGGTPTGLMAVAGWTSLDMLRRYIKAAESGLAAEESRRLDLGDF
jgi:site-specific recombinase XerD